jgi:hypothetical protein
MFSLYLLCLNSLTKNHIDLLIINKFDYIIIDLIKNISLQKIIKNNLLNLIQNYQNYFTTRQLEYLFLLSGIYEKKDIFTYLSNNFLGLINVCCIELAKRGKLSMLKWLQCNYTSHFHCSPAVFDIAAEYGHLDVIKWLFTNNYGTNTTNAMDNAAKNGHLNIIKWISENCKITCTIQAANYATLNGHFEIVKWLLLKCSINCSNATLKKIEHKFPHIYQWLLKNIVVTETISVNSTFFITSGIMF